VAIGQVFNSQKKRQQLIELCETALENDLAEQRSG